MLVQEVREFQLRKLDLEYIALRKLVADPKFVTADNDQYRNTVQAIVERTSGLAHFNRVAQHKVAADANAQRNGQAPAAQPSDLDALLSQVLAEQPQ